MELAFLIAAWVAMGGFGQYLMYLLMWRDFKGRRMSVTVADILFFAFISVVSGPASVVAAIFAAIVRAIKAAFRSSGILLNTVLIKGEE